MTMKNAQVRTALPRRQDFIAGLVVIGMAMFAFWQAADLPIGTLGGMGSGMLPRSLAVLLGLLGGLLILGAVAAFALTVRPYGLVVAGPLAILISAFASAEVRWIETIVWGSIMTAFCIGLFKFALGLPIPLAPWLLGY